ncbi:F-type H+-transporting ATPase subunit a [Breznakia sp. PF5-3]|uniref:F0F1 ATP synthase subunit A n=1 Tax=unclassified Breznakia TaxID=2623764 RepID=UPI002407506D|nr:MULTISPECIES: F0F1 ATP synthase subunit A [unclassified Breznakia]MDL2276668.1 F0F1 ATP synthase subunit A [Breznakia sp. OttesenSCG-928-G09]MDF9825719.1 F-type H+-transporting ATPase subunit a [Breznakia sp. PM6-1]MDF9836549.1 F-type H+-transporting ATPase subunit a [Breznakia sp. PF5-3]MDF9838340.1 F-type H+-transporting ATPase subunit a [Breznakia sp. PFB2-8]MDF9860368.1 F-type H+-transporting ATPase subunit a [Breznakia sp. PH5-24]
MDEINGLLITIGDFELVIHQSILIWLVICLFVTLLLVWAGSKIKKADPTKAPTGVVLVFEQVVNLCSMVVKGNLNEKTWKYLPFMGTIMIVMVISNLMGLLGLQPPTSNISVTITLTLMFIVLIHGSDIKLHGIKGKIKAWMEPMAGLFILNVIGDLATPISLTLRLFGNLLGGTIIISLLYFMIESLLPFSGVLFAVTPFLHMYFDIFTAFMQMYIFFTLTSFYLADAIGTMDD